MTPSIERKIRKTAENSGTFQTAKIYPGQGKQAQARLRGVSPQACFHPGRNGKFPIGLPFQFSGLSEPLALAAFTFHFAIVGGAL